MGSRAALRLLLAPVAASDTQRLERRVTHRKAPLVAQRVPQPPEHARVSLGGEPFTSVDERISARVVHGAHDCSRIQQRPYVAA